MIRFEFLLIRRNMALLNSILTVEFQRNFRAALASIDPFLKHRFVGQENKAEYTDIADIDDFECISIAGICTLPSND